LTVERLRWTNNSQPQTLQISVWLLYFNGALGLLLGSIYFALGPLLGLAALIGSIAAGVGIASERRWGYGLAVAVAVVQVLLYMWVAGGITGLFRGSILISFIFAGALLAALLHPMSRDYQRIWFK
jgi:hypothetical protein